jgi:hypothetical protein
MSPRSSDWPSEAARRSPFSLPQTRTSVRSRPFYVIVGLHVAPKIRWPLVGENKLSAESKISALVYNSLPKVGQLTFYYAIN